MARATILIFDPSFANLTAVYLIFNEAYTATTGEEWMRVALCDEALRLGRMLVQLLPGEPEVHALLALMELNASQNLREQELLTEKLKQMEKAAPST